MNKPIINIADVEFKPRGAALSPGGATAERYDAKMAFIGPAIGAQKLGYNITAVPPGKRAFPFHNHRVNEEMFMVLHGDGEIRIGDQTYLLREGDIVACPAGGTQTAHQIINTGKQELRYLAVSTKMSPDIAEYPDSRKFGVLAEFAGADGKPQAFRFVGRESQSVNYWDGE